MMSLLLVVAAATMTMAEQAVDATPIIIRASSAGKVDDFMLLLTCCKLCWSLTEGGMLWGWGRREGERKRGYDTFDL